MLFVIHVLTLIASFVRLSSSCSHPQLKQSWLRPSGSATTTAKSNASTALISSHRVTAAPSNWDAFGPAQPASALWSHSMMQPSFYRPSHSSTSHLPASSSSLSPHTDPRLVRVTLLALQGIPSDTFEWNTFRRRIDVRIDAVPRNANGSLNRCAAISFSFLNSHCDFFPHRLTTDFSEIVKFLMQLLSSASYRCSAKPLALERCVAVCTPLQTACCRLIWPVRVSV
jgi:hypothetical protein